MKGKKTGGRLAGTPNKEKPLKVFLREHSLNYFNPTIEVDGKMMSQYDIDLLDMKPSERVTAELALLKFHTPQMQATAVDMSVAAADKTLSERLRKLAAGEDISQDE